MKEINNKVIDNKDLDSKEAYKTSTFIFGCINIISAILLVYIPNGMTVVGLLQDRFLNIVDNIVLFGLKKIELVLLVAFLGSYFGLWNIAKNSHSIRARKLLILSYIFMVLLFCTKMMFLK